MELAVSTSDTARLSGPVSPTALLSGGGVTAALTAAGTGVVTFDTSAGDGEANLDLTRWHADRVQDADGLAVYLRDLDSGRVWSAGWQPVPAHADRYQVSFGLGTLQITRQDDGIESRLCLAVAPQGALVGTLTLRALDGRQRRVEITTYAEIVLHDRAADAAHPAFSKLFVQTERVAGRPVLIAKRRPRSPEDAPVWLSHWLDGAAESVSWETDRMRFIGRGRSRRDPAALGASGRLSGTTGAVLDPVVALRTVVEVGAEPVAQALGLTGGQSRDAVLQTADRLAALADVERATERAAEAERQRRRDLGLSDGEAEATQSLVGPLLMGDPRLRAPTDRIAAVQAGAADRDALGLGGTGRRVVLRVQQPAGLDALRQLAAFRRYWLALGLDVEVLAVVDEAHAEAARRVEGVRVVRADEWSRADLDLAASLAHIYAEDEVPAVPDTEDGDLEPRARTAPPAGGGLDLDDGALREFNGTGGMFPIRILSLTSHSPLLP